MGAMQIAGAVAEEIGLVYMFAVSLAAGLFGGRGTNFLRVLTIAFGIALFGGLVALAQEVIHNIFIVVLVGSARAVVGLYTPKSLGDKVTWQQMVTIGLVIALFGIAI